MVACLGGWQGHVFPRWIGRCRFEIRCTRCFLFDFIILYRGLSSLQYVQWIYMYIAFLPPICLQISVILPRFHPPKPVGHRPPPLAPPPLNQDDILDDADQRRQRQTMHQIFGPDVAVLSPSALGRR